MLRFSRSLFTDIVTNKYFAFKESSRGWKMSQVLVSDSPENLSDFAKILY